MIKHLATCSVCGAQASGGAGYAAINCPTCGLVQPTTALIVATDAYDRGHANGRAAAIEDVLTILALAGEHAEVRMLKRELGYQAPGHVCTMTSGECVECGARS